MVSRKIGVCPFDIYTCFHPSPCPTLLSDERGYGARFLRSAFHQFNRELAVLREEIEPNRDVKCSPFTNTRHVSSPETVNNLIIILLLCIGLSKKRVLRHLALRTVPIQSRRRRPAVQIL